MPRRYLRSDTGDRKERATCRDTWFDATFGRYDGPSPEAIRQAAQVNGLPVDQITEVTVLDPYFYH
jgi:hypothetical protein